MMKTVKGKNVYELREVFTPSMPARATFVERGDVNNKLVNALRTPGKQIIIYGHTGSGKSTLLINKLDQLYDKYIITRCMAGMTFDNILMHGFAELDRHYIEKVDTSRKKSFGAQLGAEYKIIKAQLSASTESNTTITTKPLMPPLLTAQFLVKFYGELNCCWVLEDFHKISPDEKTKAAQIMKIFVDSAIDYPQAKLIAIGAVNTGRDVINYDREMRNRLSQIHVQLMTDEELNEIISSGEQKLNVKFDSNVKEAIVRAASGLAAICHQLCLNCCDYKGVDETSQILVRIDEEALNSAFEEYVEDNEDSIKQDYEEAIRTEEIYGNLPELVLSNIAKYSKDEIPCKSLQKRLETQKSPNGGAFDLKDINTLLSEMQLDKRGSVLVHNERTDRYSFANPFMRVYVQCITKGETLAKDITHRQEIDSLLHRMAEKMYKTYFEGIADDNDDYNDMFDDGEDLLEE
jgi:energy-coupling factor transporter ATP-binding protein EcfA2